MADFTIPITVPDGRAVEIRDTLHRRFGGDDADTNADKVAHIREKIREWIKGEFVTQKEIEAQQSAGQTAVDDAELADFSE